MNSTEMLLDSLAARAKNLKSVILNGEKKILPTIAEINVIIAVKKPYCVYIDLIPENPEDPNIVNLEKVNALLYQEGPILGELIEGLESSIKILEGNQLETISRGIKKASKTIKNNLSDILEKVKK